MHITLSWVVLQRTLNLHTNINVQFIGGVVKPEEVMPSPLSSTSPPGCCGPVPSPTAACAAGGPFVESVELGDCKETWIWGKGAGFVGCRFCRLTQLNKTLEKQQHQDGGHEGSVWLRRRRGGEGKVHR